MRLLLLFLFICAFSYSQDTVDVAVDSLHRSLFGRMGLSIQNWTPRITRSQNNLKAVSVLSESFDIAMDTFSLPFDGYMTSRYGIRWNAMHAGVDIALRTGDTVRSAWDGVVRYAMMNRGGYGNLVIVRHRNGLETYYAHLSRVKVESGQFVSAGEMVGLGGNTGHSFGAHLHFEIRFYDVSIDPEKVVDFRQAKVVSHALAITPELVNGRVPVMNDFDEFESVEFVAGVVFPLAGTLGGTTPASLRVYHTVRKGDCLEKIARRNQTSVQDLCRLNHLDELKWLYVGQRIRVK